MTTHAAEQLALPEIPVAPLALDWPTHGTAAAFTLDMMLAGARVTPFDLPPEYLRLSSYVHVLGSMGWPVQAARCKHERKGSRVGFYWLTAATIEKAKAMRPLDLKVTTAADLPDVKNRAAAQPAPAEKPSKVNSVKVNSVKVNSVKTDMKSDGAIEQAVEFLRHALTGNGYTPTKSVEGMAAEQGITPKTLERARKLLKVQTAKVGTTWHMRLPGDANDGTKG